MAGMELLAGVEDRCRSFLVLVVPLVMMPGIYL
jgi:hypothetical protein